MIVTIRNDVLSDPVHCDTGQTIEFTLTVAILAKLFHKNAICIEHLYTMVGWICYYNAIIWSDGNASRPCKTSGLAPATTQLEQLSTFLQVLRPRGDTCYALCIATKCLQSINRNFVSKSSVETINELNFRISCCNRHRHSYQSLYVSHLMHSINEKWFKVRLVVLFKSEQ